MLAEPLGCAEPRLKITALHILLQSTPDSIIDGVYVRTVWWPDRRLDEVGYVVLQKLDC